MPYITDTERLAKKEGRAEGRAKGRAEGRNEGLTEGQLQRAREDVIEALEIRFGEVPYSVREKVNHVNNGATLKRLHRLAITVTSLDKFSV